MFFVSKDEESNRLLYLSLLFLVKNFLRENKIEFEDLDVAADKKAREETIKKTGQLAFLL